MLTEIYLTDISSATATAAATTDLNAYVTLFNADAALDDRLGLYTADDLNKIAFDATGSGKTLLMHINILRISITSLHDEWNDQPASRSPRRPRKGFPFSTWASPSSPNRS